MSDGMCPHCGMIVGVWHSLTIDHGYYGEPCPGSKQNPRNWESDRRRLWNGEPNPHLCIDCGVPGRLDLNRCAGCFPGSITTPFFVAAEKEGEPKQ